VHDDVQKIVQEFMSGRKLAGRSATVRSSLSDLHLGTPGCQAEALLEFLKTHTCDTLYLVGDIIDGWQLRRKWYWPQAHNDVVQKLLRKSSQGGAEWCMYQAITMSLHVIF
jgi:hypothetical protein